MNECPACQAKLKNDEMICSECGYVLFARSPLETDPSGSNAARLLNDLPDQPGLKPLVQPSTQPLILLLKIGANKREVELPLDQPVNIGRSDPTKDLFPEIDLSDDGTEATSVSRFHAKIYKWGGTAVIEDLGSANGTFLNGKKLIPHTINFLHADDILQLGTLRIEVNIQKG
jgi:pSer/pThr/pTyr-binding forkhead associated (FHA) protein